MKKLTALLLALLIALGALALTSCDDDEKDDKKDNKKDDDIEIVDNKGWSPSFKP